MHIVDVDMRPHRQRDGIIADPSCVRKRLRAIAVAIAIIAQMGNGLRVIDARADPAFIEFADNLKPSRGERAVKNDA